MNPDYHSLNALLLWMCATLRTDVSRLRRLSVAIANPLADSGHMPITSEQRAALAEVGRQGGQAKSERKAEAARRNGCRPKRKKITQPEKQ